MTFCADTSSFDIPCSIFNIQSKPGGLATARYSVSSVQYSVKKQRQQSKPGGLATLRKVYDETMA